MREIRAIRDDELDQLCRVVGEAFNERDTSWVIEQQRYEPGYQHWQTQVAVVDGRVVSSLLMLMRPCYYGSAILPMMGIGNVSTLPREQGKGHASALMMQAAVISRERGYPLGMLFTDTPGFYRRLGWESITLEGVRYQPRDTAPADTTFARLTPGSFTAADLEPIAPIYEAANRGQIGPVARSDTYWRENVLRRWQRAHLWRAKGAYLCLDLAQHTLDLTEGGCLPGAEAELQGLLAEAAHMARALGKAHLRAPRHHALRPELWGGLEAGTRGALGPAAGEPFAATTVMYAVFDWPALIAAALPALCARWEQAGRPTLDFTLRHHTGAVHLVAGYDGLQLTERPGGTLVAELDDAQAVMLFLGQWERVPRLAAQPGLRVLFTGPPPSFWMADAF